MALLIRLQIPARSCRLVPQLVHDTPKQKSWRIYWPKSNGVLLVKRIPSLKKINKNSYSSVISKFVEQNSCNSKILFYKKNSRMRIVVWMTV